MATVHFATLPANSALTQLLNSMNAGATGATAKFYTGTMPASPETAITSQVLLGTVTFAKPAGAVANKQLVAGSITMDPEADAAGTATWVRLADGDGVPILDGDVSAIGGGGIFQLNITTIAAGGPLRLTSFMIYLP